MWLCSILSHKRSWPRLYLFELFRGIKFSYVTDDYGRQLKQCKDLEEGKRLHTEIIARGYGGDTYLGNHLIRMYATFESLDDATQVFANLPERNVFSWNILLHAFASCGHLESSRRVFSRMPERSIVSWNNMLWLVREGGGTGEAKDLFDEAPSRNVISWATLAAALARAGKVGDATLVCAKMPQWNAVACTGLVEYLAQCGKVAESKAVFEAMPERSSVSWNVLISACACSGLVDGCAAVFERMPARDVVSWNSLMQAYADHSCAADFEAVFAAMPVHNLVTRNALIAAYACHGLPDRAKLVFEEMPGRDVLSWVLLARALATGSDLDKLLDRIPRHSLVVANVAFHARAKSGDLGCATGMFLSQEHRDLFSWTTMVLALADQSCLEQARHAFELMPGREVSAWNGLLAGYSRAGDVGDAKLLFDAMPERDLTSWTCMAAVAGGDVHAAMQRVPARDVVLWNIATAAHAHAGELEQAKATFDTMDERDTVSWNTLISAYAAAGQWGASMATFAAMDLEGVEADALSYVSLVEAVSSNSCSSLDSICRLHRMIAEVEGGQLLARETKVANAVLNMYAKRGLLQAASDVFHAMHSHNVVTWSTLIAAHAAAASSAAALAHTLHLFGCMQLHGVAADGVTFVSLLAACSHAGHLENAVAVFVAVVAGDFGNVEATLDHYVCVIDAFARTGRVADAYQLLCCMPFEPNALAWQTLLSGSKHQVDFCQSVDAFHELYDLLPPALTMSLSP